MYTSFMKCFFSFSWIFTCVLLLTCFKEHLKLREHSKITFSQLNVNASKTFLEYIYVNWAATAIIFDTADKLWLQLCITCQKI